MHRVITSEEALQRYPGHILATPKIGLRLSNNPDLYHRSVYGIEYSCATLPSQGHYSTTLKCNKYNCVGKEILLASRGHDFLKK